MSELHTYLPQDRLRALARGEQLPDRASGSVLFADVSGFTPLAESLHEKLGPRRGAEELTWRLNKLYNTLVAEVEKYGGNVMDFAGDAITCWFDEKDGPSSIRATACAFAFQTVMKSLPDFEVKVVVTSGTARRFAVGDPEVHQMDTLAGAAVTRAALAEHVSGQGEIILDDATIQVLGSSVVISKWYPESESGERFASVTRFDSPMQTINHPLPHPGVDDSVLRAWTHRHVYEREHAGQGEFLAEFRPCIVMFVRFLGIDFESEAAAPQLDEFLRHVQAIALEAGGTLLQVTIGDKGSYAYLIFGALTAYEDEARRAVHAALSMRDTARRLHYLRPLQIGISNGVLYVGAYGGETRKTFSALGDEVNLAARLMMVAEPGEVLLSGSMQKSLETSFSLEPRPAVYLKGKAEPLTVFTVTGERRQRAIRLPEPTYSLPMVGRQSELQLIGNKLDLTLQNKSQVIGIVAEAGMGKSRLVAEVIRLAHRKGFTGYGGACQSDGVNTPYLAWKSVWGAFFDVNPAASLKKQIRQVETAIEDLAPGRVQAIPLLNIVLDLNIPDNDFTQSLEPKYRKSALSALFEDCLRAATKDEPLLVVLEDLHWMDALSHDLLETLAKALADCPICFVLAYRPPQLLRLQEPRLSALPNFTRIDVNELSRAECEQVIQAKLAQLYPARSGTVSSLLVDKLMARSQGNPYFLEELLNYLHDRGLDPRDPATLERIELPDSLHTLILSRIDQLVEHEKTTLRVASIIGRLFRAKWLTGYYPALGDQAQVRSDLEQLDRLDITPLDTPEPELAYLFKHIVTHEVTYESISYATRAKLHEQLAQYLEAQIACGAMVESSLLEALVYHYTRSENKEKQCEYLRKAGKAAQKSYDNATALDYYGRLLTFLTEAEERVEILLERGAVLELIGKWTEAERDYRTALDLAGADTISQASAQCGLGKLCRKQGDFSAALDWLAQARVTHAALNDKAQLVKELIETSLVLVNQGNYELAYTVSTEALVLARAVGEKGTLARALNNLGSVVYVQGDYATAQPLYKESLALRRELGDEHGISASLNNLGNVAFAQDDYATARTMYQDGLALMRKVGDKYGISASLSVLGNVAFIQGDYAMAQSLYKESLALQRELGDQQGIARSLNNLGNVTFAQDDYAAAWAMLEEGLALQRKIGNKRGVSVSLNDLGKLAYIQGDYASAQKSYEESLTLCREMGDKAYMAYALLGLGLVALGSSPNDEEAREHILASLRLRQELGARIELTSSLIGVAGFAARAGNFRRAANLFGAVDSSLKLLKAPMQGEVRQLYAQMLATVRTQLGEAAFQSAWEDGSRLSIEETVKMVLEE